MGSRDAAELSYSMAEKGGACAHCFELLHCQQGK